MLSESRSLASMCIQQRSGTTSTSMSTATQLAVVSQWSRHCRIVRGPTYCRPLSAVCPRSSLHSASRQLPPINSTGMIHNKHFHLSHTAVHHLHHLHYHRLHLLLLAQYFNSRLGSSANPFLHLPFPFLPDWLHGLSDHLMILLCLTNGFVARCVRLSRLLVGFRTHFKSLHFHIHFISFNSVILSLTVNGSLNCSQDDYRMYRM